MIATSAARNSRSHLHLTTATAASTYERASSHRRGRLANKSYQGDGGYNEYSDSDSDSSSTSSNARDRLSSSAAAAQLLRQRNITMTRVERERSRMFVRALYDYSTEDTTSLSFRAGDVIQVLKQLDSGWWDGIVNGQRGWFPSNYCILVPPGEANGGMLSDDSDDADEDDSYDEYDDGSQSSDSERGLASPGLPMEGTNIGKDVSGLWVPQATPHGRLYYFNLETAETRQELPLEAPATTTETGPRDATRIVPDHTRPPPELLARGYERDDDESASDKGGRMIVLNSPMVSASAAQLGEGEGEGEGGREGGREGGSGVDSGFIANVLSITRARSGNVGELSRRSEHWMPQRLEEAWMARPAWALHKQTQPRPPLRRRRPTSPWVRRNCGVQPTSSTRMLGRRCRKPGTS